MHMSRDFYVTVIKAALPHKRSARHDQMWNGLKRV